jgi:uncharacterized protein (UPF0261 family)
MTDKTILLVGTYDTKNAELDYMAQRIASQNGGVLTMDVSVLGNPELATDISKHQVAQAAGSSIQAAIDSGDENSAMQIMTQGATLLASQLYSQGKIDGVLLLGGSMATDLALDVCQGLPLGVPKYIVSTVAFSPMIAAHRLSADIQMILWAGGLYGLNSICKSSLSQAAGAVLGAARAVEPPATDRPLIGMTSLGSSCLKYMKTLKPELEARGFELVVFHATGMGGMAFEHMAAQGRFVCVMDFCLQEVCNQMAGSVINSGPQRMLSAGAAGIPQLVAPGSVDLLDFPGWQNVAELYPDRPAHAHNRLIHCIVSTVQERQAQAREFVQRLSQGQASAPVHMILPEQGIEEWDRPGQDLHDPEGLAAFVAEIKSLLPNDKVQLTSLDAHINDAQFCDTVLEIFDVWVEQGLVNKDINHA